MGGGGVLGGIHSRIHAYFFVNSRIHDHFFDHAKLLEISLRFSEIAPNIQNIPNFSNLLIKFLKLSHIALKSLNEHSEKFQNCSTISKSLRECSKTHEDHFFTVDFFLSKVYLFFMVFTNSEEYPVKFGCEDLEK